MICVTKNIIASVLVTYITFHVTGCIPIYSPNAITIPLFTHQNELHTTVYATTGHFENTYGIDANISYSLTQRIAISAGASLFPKPDRENYRSHKYGEFAIGFYMPLKRRLIMEMFGGFGRGTAESQERDDMVSFNIGHPPLYPTWPRFLLNKGQYNQFFLQLNLGASKGIFVAGYALRGSYVDFFTLRQKETIYKESEIIEKNTFKKANGLFIQPVFFVRLGGDNVKFDIQFGLLFPLEENIDFDWKKYQISAGLSLFFKKNK